MSPFIRLRAISKSFLMGEESIAALNKIDLDIEQGDFVSISGASGSGKSTLLYILGLLDTPTSGEYWLDGIRSDQLSENQKANLRNRLIGFVFQGFHLLPKANALRNVAMPLVYSETPVSKVETAKQARMALEKVGLGDRLTHLPNELSGGQRQRVAIARAMVNNPKLILADEPTGNLDSRRGLEIIEIFKTLNHEGCTIIMVTHDPNIASQAKRQLELKDGQIIFDSRQGNHALV